ncbi:hypothetical protein FACS189419_07850 [Planctomycetales bacterium]|nr:hypothetical protein FACS189419_07850 [Planctomycetales bacterium]
MGVLAIYYQSTSESPLLLALNREERLDRASTPPRIQSGRPRIVCGVDSVASGTWAGVNQYGLFVALLNAPKCQIPEEPRSRGLLCRDLLALPDAETALDIGLKEVQSQQYAGCNILCADLRSGGVIHGGDEMDVEKLKPGLHVLSENRLDDRYDERQEFVRRQLTLQRIDSPVSFFAIASKTFSRRTNPDGKLGVLVSKRNVVTASSMMLSLTEKSHRSSMQYANGSPDIKTYDDISALLRQVLSTERAAKAAAAAKESKTKDNEQSTDI